MSGFIRFICIPVIDTIFLILIKASFLSFEPANGTVRLIEVNVGNPPPVISECLKQS